MDYTCSPSGTHFEPNLYTLHSAMFMQYRIQNLCEIPNNPIDMHIKIMNRNLSQRGHQGNNQLRTSCHMTVLCRS